MTIRYQCDECGSVLKIRDDKAGTTGHCPKCQSEFIVPEPEAEPESEPEAPAPAAAQEQPAPKKKAAATAKAPAPAKAAPPAVASDDEFDPAAFLMEGDDAPPPKPAPATPQPPPPVDRRPAAPPERPAAKRPEKKPARRTPADDDLDPNSAAASANAMLAGDTNASSNAKQLLTRTMEESRVRAAQMPEDEEPGVDYATFFREVGTRGLLIIGGLVLAVALAYWFGNYMAGGGIDLPDLARVRGVVTKGGAPLAGATVTYTPIDVDTASATAVTEEDGSYDMYYLEGIRGAVVGRNRVFVELIDSNGRPVVPPREDYGFGSDTIHEVPPGGDTINITIP